MGKVERERHAKTDQVIKRKGAQHRTRGFDRDSFDGRMNQLVVRTGLGRKNGRDARALITLFRYITKHKLRLSTRRLAVLFLDGFKRCPTLDGLGIYHVQIDVLALVKR